MTKVKSFDRDTTLLGAEDRIASDSPSVQIQVEAKAGLVPVVSATDLQNQEEIGKKIWGFMTLYWQGLQW